MRTAARSWAPSRVDFSPWTAEWVASDGQRERCEHAGGPPPWTKLMSALPVTYSTAQRCRSPLTTAAAASFCSPAHDRAAAVIWGRARALPLLLRAPRAPPTTRCERRPQRTTGTAPASATRRSVRRAHSAGCAAGGCAERRRRPHAPRERAWPCAPGDVRGSCCRLSLRELCLRDHCLLLTGCSLLLLDRRCAASRTWPTQRVHGARCVRDVRGSRRRWRVSLGLRRLAKCVRADIALMRLSSLELAAFRLRDRDGVCAGWCGMRMR